MSSAEDRRSIEVMRREIATIPAVIDDQVQRLRPDMRAYVAALPRELSEVILTGCGDSHYAGIATRLAFEQVAGLRCRASEALELARYEVKYVPVLPAPPLLVAVSYSGEVGRTIEAAATADRFGWHTLALTGRREGRLAQASRNVVVMAVPTLGFSPGTSTYVAMLAAILVLAAELARAHGRTAQAAALDDALARTPDLAASTLEGADESAHRLAAIMAQAPTATFLGAGPSRASAAFGAAKLFEGPQRYGVVQDLEEWAHEQYFVSGPATPVIVVAPEGPSRSRAGELLSEMTVIGAPNALVSDRTDDAIAQSAGIILPVTPGVAELVSPILTCLPLALVSFFLSQQLGSRSYGFPSEAREREHYATIHRDTRVEPA